jgi:branched-chain amino acid transport system substrate-binding protein
MRFTPGRLAAITALLLAAPITQAQTVVKIGAAFSLTGNAAAYGAQQKAGVLLAVDEINKSGKLPGIKLEAVVEDDGTNPQQGIQVFDRFINRDKVSAILGPTLSTLAEAADPRAQEQKTPVVAVSNTKPNAITTIGDYIWRVSLTEAQVIPSAIEIAKGKLGFKTAGLLYGNDDAFTKAGYDVMKATLESQGVQILGTQTFAKPDKDYTAQLTSLLAAKPDILIVSALVENASGIVAQARQLGWQGPIFGGNGFNSPKLIGNAGPAAEGVYVGTAWNKVSTDAANVAFQKAMADRKHEPDQFCAQAWTGVVVIAEAVKLSGGKGGRDDVKAGFLKVKDLPTPLGKFSFLANRDGSHDPALQVVKDGKFQIVP